MRHCLSFYLLLGTYQLLGQMTVATVWSSEAERRSLGAERPAESRAPVFESRAGLLIVRARLEGEWANFILDTGAGELLLNAQLNASSGTELHSFWGSQRTAPRAVDELHWAGISLRNVTALQVNMRHLERWLDMPLGGILGYDLFRQQVLLLDLGRERMLVNPTQLPPAREWQRLDTRSHLPIVKIKVDGKTLRFGIDSGASVNMLDERAKHRLPAAYWQPSGTRQLSGIEQRATTVPVVTMIGDNALEAERFGVADLSAFGADEGIRLDGLLGRPFLDGHVVLLDYARRRVWISDHRPDQPSK